VIVLSQTMTTPLLLASALLAGLPAPAALPAGGGPPTFHLVYRAKVDRLQVECTWDSVQVLQPTGPSRRSAGRLVVPYKEVAAEILTLETQAFDRVLMDVVEAVPGTPVVALPEDARILFHWQAATGEVEFLPAFKHPWATAKEPGNVAFTRVVEDWPEDQDSPGWDGPPRAKSFLLTEWRPGSRMNGRIPAGTGFARVEHTGFTVFAASRDTALGLSQAGGQAPTWWLQVAEDDQGNRWLWFERE